MAKASQKITLSASRDIPFNKLSLSQSNVWRLRHPGEPRRQGTQAWHSRVAVRLERRVNAASFA
jgi:hypothetical protein